MRSFSSYRPALAALAVALALAPRSARAQECALADEGFSAYECGCYMELEEMKQEKSVDACADYGGYLVDGRTGLDVDAIASSLAVQEYIWTTAEKSGSSYEFSNGELVKQPKTDALLSGSEDCVVFDPINEVYLDADCDDSHFAICNGGEIDDDFNEWSSWSTCSCYTRSRERTCGDSGCCEENELYDSEYCENSEDPDYGDWGSWGECSVRCGDDGTRMREKTCSADCCAHSADPYEEEESCFARDCPCENDGFFLPYDSTLGCVCFSNPYDSEMDVDLELAQDKVEDKCKNRDAVFLSAVATDEMAIPTKDDFIAGVRNSLTTAEEEAIEEEDLWLWTDVMKVQTEKSIKQQKKDETLEAEYEWLDDFGEGDEFEGDIVNADDADGLECLAYNVGAMTYSAVDCDASGIYALCTEKDVIASNLETWGEWTDCEEDTCTTTSIRSRECDDTCCVAEDFEEEDLEDVCDSEWGEWEVWQPSGDCSESCGLGSIDAYRWCTTDCCALGDFDTIMDATTKTLPCIVSEWDEWASWGEYGSCSASCGVGTAIRTRETADVTGCFNEDSGEDEEVADCGFVPEWSSWGDWNACDNSCGSGFANRTRDYVGYCVPDEGLIIEFESCDTLGEWQDWGEWSSCRPVCTFHSSDYYDDDGADGRSLAAWDFSDDDHFAYINASMFGSLTNGERMRVRPCQDGYACCEADEDLTDAEFEPCGWFQPAYYPKSSGSSFADGTFYNMTVSLYPGYDLFFNVTMDFFDYEANFNCSNHGVFINGDGPYCNSDPPPENSFRTDHEDLELVSVQRYDFDSDYVINSRGFALTFTVGNWDSDLTDLFCLGDCRFHRGGYPSQLSAQDPLYEYETTTET